MELSCDRQRWTSTPTLVSIPTGRACDNKVQIVDVVNPPPHQTCMIEACVRRRVSETESPSGRTVVLARDERRKIEQRVRVSHLLYK